MSGEVRYLRVAKFCELTGWTDRAVRRKIQEGVWLEGREYRRAPEGSILIDMQGYNQWVEREGAPPRER
jgi:hypothetical protein